jgi:hypothetical protein
MFLIGAHRNNKVQSATGSIPKRPFRYRPELVVNIGRIGLGFHFSLDVKI